MPERGEFTGPFTDADFLAGSLVRFTDVGIVASEEDGPTVCEGRINGAAIASPGTDRWMVPVWTERDHGREATTIYVDTANLLSIRPPERVAGDRPPPPDRHVPRPPVGEQVFTDDELAAITLAVHQATRGQNFARDLDPLEVSHADVAVHRVTGMPAVLVTLEDGRRFRLLIDPVPAP